MHNRVENRVEKRGENTWDKLELSLEDLFDLASQAVTRRGLSYARAGRVTDLVAVNGRLEARVAGERSMPYLVVLEYDGEEILSVCSCPFDWEPFCKHAIAALAVQFALVGEQIDPAAELPSLEREEVEVRRRRGDKGGFRITRREGDSFFGVFDVHSPSERTYTVEIRSLAQRLNLCSCRDFAGATLGTCKHIEATLAALRKRQGKRAFERAAAAPPTIAQVLVDQRDRPRIRLRLPARPSPALGALARDFFDAERYFRRDPVDDMPAFLARARRLRKAVVYGDVIEFSEAIAAERRAEQRGAEVTRKILAAGASIPGVNARLYPFQVEGTAFLAARGRALLGDDMGLGKTVQAIAATRVLRSRGDVHRALVVCPASLKHQWASEIERFTGIECQIVGGGARARLDQYRRRAPFTIANYELVLRDRYGLAQLEPDLLILDEAQRIRNWRTKTAAAIKDITTPFAFVLTGTPLQNRLDDLYSVMQVVDGRILGPLWAYNHNFVVREERRNRILGYKNLDELRRRIAPAVLRRAKDEVKLQLPERIDSRLGIELTPRQRELMDENVAIAARLAKLAEKRPLTPKEEKRLFMAMQSARMACNCAGLVDKETLGSPKLDEFEQLIRDLCLDRGRKVIVFSEWETFCRLAAQRAERLGIGFTRLHGAIPTPKRGAIIERFRDDPECLLFFSTDAGGLGLNLQFASTMINLELPWNPAVLDQRIGRIHRHGQTDPVHVLMLVAENSFESGLETTLLAKRELFAAALDQRSAVERVKAPSSCLSAVRAALVELQSELEPGREPVLVGQCADKVLDGADSPKSQTQATTASAAGESQPDTAARDVLAEPPPEQRIAQLLGPRLERVVELASGRMVALVDHVDQGTTAAAESLGMTAIEARAESALAALGSESLFAGARVLLDRTRDDCGRRDAERQNQLALAQRKLEAAETLATADLGAEAIEQAHASMTAALYALAAHAGLEGGGEQAAQGPAGGNAEGSVGRVAVARLLYEALVPRGLLTLEQAAVVSRAEGLARAYAGVTQPVAPATVQSVLADARQLLERVSTGD